MRNYRVYLSDILNMGCEGKQNTGLKRSSKKDDGYWLIPQITR